MPDKFLTRFIGLTFFISASAAITAAGAQNSVNTQSMPIAHTIQSAPAELVAARDVPIRQALLKLPQAVSDSDAVQVAYQQASYHEFHACKLIDEGGRSVSPSSIEVVGSDLYLLGPANLWRIRDGAHLVNTCQTLTCTAQAPGTHKINGFPLQEFDDFVYFPLHKTLIVLEKSGDLVEFNPASSTWRTAWPNKPITYSPDPDFISLAAVRNTIVLLDPERNELWRFDGHNIARLFTPEVLPWKVKSQTANVTDGIAMCKDDGVFVLKRSGVVTEYGGVHLNKVIRQYGYNTFRELKPTRICDSSQALLLSDREDNMVTELNRCTGTGKSVCFPGNFDLRGLRPNLDGFLIIDGSSLVCVPIAALTVDTTCVPSPRPLDPRLKRLRMPIHHCHLPRHPGVWPGARRLYRYGVHKGVDFFYDAGCGIKIGTPVLAAADGKIVRIDGNFKDMTQKQFSKVMQECVRNHNTSAADEDLFRGCQVWIDHGNGLMTKYAHLDHVNRKLHKGASVKCGSVIGYVGVSGTGENLPGRVKQPHLHFEIWVDGNYLGYGLTPAETIAVLERIFSTGYKSQTPTPVLKLKGGRGKHENHRTHSKRHHKRRGTVRR